MSNQQFLSYTMTRTSYFLLRRWEWWWGCLFCTRQTHWHWIGIL